MYRFVPKTSGERRIPLELSQTGVPGRLLELLVDRGIDTPEAIEAYLHPKKENLHDPMRMQGMDRAVDVVRDALQKGEEIVIFGDYDVDGVTATAILLTYLRKQGAKAHFYIPDRHGEGYGLNMAAVERIADHARLLITVDCGITCAAEVARAQALGMRVIVTDHHQLPPQLPECEAVLNPLMGDYPFRRLCGAGVAFKLVQALGGSEAIEPLWELAALATVADIVPLLGENRVIVAHGLRAMAETKRPGLLALMESAGVEPQRVCASDVAYRMAPRINAGGRLALASRGVELLTTRRMDAAREIAAELAQDNVRRRELELSVFNEAERITRETVDFCAERAIVVCGEGWNTGVVGLAASRLVEKYRWPVVLLSREGELCVGSARSIPGVDIHKALSACSDLFVRFGGHAQAAGLTLEARHLPELRRRLSEAIREIAEPDAFIPTEQYDLELELPEMTEELVQAFDAMQPTGFGNPAPVFCVRGVRTADAKAIGKDGSHLRMRLLQGGEMRGAVAFRMGEAAASMPEVIEAVTSLSVNEWQGRRSVQCEIKRFQAYMPAKAFAEDCARREAELTRRFLGALELPQTKDAPAREERMTLTQAIALLKEELAASHQGTLLCVHTLSALRLLNVHLALLRAQMDYAVGVYDDVRMFNTLMMLPDWAAVARAPRLIVALDGFLSPGEREQAETRFPDARVVEVTDLGAHAAKEAARLLPEDGALRAFYKALREREHMGDALGQLAERAGLTEGAACCAMRIFRELGLVAFEAQPFGYRLLSTGRVSLDGSALRARLTALRGGTAS